VGYDVFLFVLREACLLWTEDDVLGSIFLCFFLQIFLAFFDKKNPLINPCVITNVFLALFVGYPYEAKKITLNYWKTSQPCECY
jgi:hypothetical protein